MRLSRPHGRQEVKNPPRGPVLFAASGRDALLMMPRPLSRCQINAEIKGFLLMYHLFLYYQWFSQNIEKGWRKIFEKDYCRDFLKMMKFQKKKSSSLFQFSERTIASTQTNDTSAESPGSQLSFATLKVGVALPWSCHALSPKKNIFYPARTYAFRGQRA